MKVGDCIKIKEGVSLAGMPVDKRDGLVIELIGQDGWNRDDGFVLIMFPNHWLAKFHTSQIEVVNENR